MVFNEGSLARSIIFLQMGQIDLYKDYLNSKLTPQPKNRTDVKYFNEFKPPEKSNQEQVYRRRISSQKVLDSFCSKMIIRRISSKKFRT